MENPLKFSLTTRFKDRYFVKLLSPLAGKHLLDIGCGIGYLSGLMASHGAKVCSVDIDFSAVAYSASMVVGQFSVASATALPFSSNTFDCVTFADVIEHLPVPEEALSEIYRVAKPGASVIISTPHLKGWLTGTWVTSMLHEENAGPMADHREGYNANDLSILMDNCGIMPRDVRYTNPFVSQLVLGFVKLGYRVTNATYTTQCELIDISQSWRFQLYRSMVFPVVYAAGRIEEAVLGRWVPGHCLIVRGTVTK